VSAHQLAAPELRAAAANSSLSPGSIVITGGTGALGLLVASWLVGSQGSRELVLVGRSGRAVQPASCSASASPTQRQLQALLSGSAAVITVIAADTAAASDSAGVFAAVLDSGSCLAGVVHAAGVLEDAAIPNQTLGGLRRCVWVSMRAVTAVCFATLYRIAAHSIHSRHNTLTPCAYALGFEVPRWLPRLPGGPACHTSRLPSACCSAASPACSALRDRPTTRLPTQRWTRQPLLMLLVAWRP
jgi:hypothetical protein